MKALKIIALLLCLHLAAFTQEKIEKYCELQFYTKGWSKASDLTINMYFSIGAIDSLFSFKDTTIITNLKKVKTLKTKADVLNYMSAMNWSAVFFTSNTFIFKRVFDKSEMTLNK